MKTHFLLTGLLVLFMFSSFAQTEQSSVMIGGDFSFSYSKEDMDIGENGNGISAEVENILISTNPKLGYFFLRNFAVGVDFNYDFQNSYDPDAPDDNEIISTRYFAGPFIRFYAPLGETVSLLGEANTAYGQRSIDITRGGIETEDRTNSLFTWGVGPGIAIFPNPNVGIEGIAKYNWFKEEDKLLDDEDTPQNTINSFDFKLGLMFYL